MSEPLDSRQLNAFVILAKTGSYSATARELHVTHSAISHAMRALEGNAGCRLLARMGKTVTLTEAGEALLQHAEPVLIEMRRARATLEGLNKWGVSRLRLGVEPALHGSWFTQALMVFHEEFPRVVITVEVLSGRDAGGLLETSRVDLALGERILLDDRLEFSPLFSDRLQLIVNAQHPWAVRGSVPREELGRQPCVLHRTSDQTRRAVTDYFARSGVVLNPVLEIECLEAVREFLKQTSLMSVLPAWMVQQDLDERKLVGLSPGRKSLEQTWGFTHRRSRPLNHAESAFVKICREKISALTAGGEPGA